jgi:hypothetical protein
MKDSRSYMDNEVRIMQRGSYYLTPFLHGHVSEFISVIHPENVREIIRLGYENVADGLAQMVEDSECYIARDGQGKIVFVGGVTLDADTPQMFALFTKDIKENFTLLARGSKMLVSLFDQSYPMMSMTIYFEYYPMISWAEWLGFEIVGCSEYLDAQYVEFVRCNPNKNFVVSDTARPVMH